LGGSFKFRTRCIKKRGLLTRKKRTELGEEGVMNRRTSRGVSARK